MRSVTAQDSRSYPSVTGARWTQQHLLRAKCQVNKTFKAVAAMVQYFPCNVPTSLIQVFVDWLFVVVHKKSTQWRQWSVASRFVQKETVEIVCANMIVIKTTIPKDNRPRPFANSPSDLKTSTSIQEAPGRTTRLLDSPLSNMHGSETPWLARRKQKREPGNLLELASSGTNRTKHSNGFWSGLRHLKLSTIWDIARLSSIKRSLTLSSTWK